jgi:ABC-type polysaccharide/polyol phosphate export permease
MTGAQQLTSPDDFLALILQGLSTAQRNSVAERRIAFEHIYRRHEQMLVNRHLPEETVDLQYRFIRTLGKSIELDIRAGIDVFAEGYRPDGMDETFRRLDVGRQRRRVRREAEEARAARRQSVEMDIAHEIELAPGDAAILANLRLFGARQPPALPRGHEHEWALNHARAITALLIYQLQLIGGENRIALLWTLAAPAVLLTLISAFYFLIGTKYILNMDVPTFALLGSTTWIMLRQIIFRVSQVFISSRPLMNFAVVTPLDAAIAQAILYQMIYAAAFAILLLGGNLLGLVTLTSNWAPVAGLIVATSVFALSIGLIFGSIAVHRPFFLRFASVIERFLEIFSSVFIVSEQLPEQYRPYFLWSPLAHSMQLLRSAYFPGYDSTDASLSYFLTCLVVIGAIGLLCERSVRPAMQPM